MTKNFIILSVVVIVGGGLLLVTSSSPSEVPEIEENAERQVEEGQSAANTVAETKFGDFNIDTSVSSLKVEVDKIFTVFVSVTDQTPDLINAIASGDPAELERYKKPWIFDGLITAKGPVVPAQVYITADKTSQEDGPEEVAFGSVFTRTGTFTCREKGIVLVDLGYIIERKLDDNTPPLNPVLDKPRAADGVLVVADVECVEKKQKPPEDGGSTGGTLDEGFIYLGPQYLIICDDGTSLSGYYKRDQKTHEVITDAAGNGLDLDTGLPVVCPGG